MKLTNQRAALALGVSLATHKRYRASGAPFVIGLACAALANGLEPWAK